MNPCSKESGRANRRHRRRLFAATAVAVAAAVAVPAASASASQAYGSPVVGHVYLDDSTAGANTIAGFDRHADGTLTGIPGSPFTAGGAGTGTGLASEGAVQFADRGRFLLAADGGSNQVSVLLVEPGGALASIDVVSSGGIRPVSIAVHGSLVYVANAGAGGSNYTGFRLSPAGILTPVPRSTVVLPDSAQPGDVLFNATGTRLIGTEVNSSLIDSFTVQPDGRLKAAPGSPFPASGGRPVWERVQADESRPVVRNQRPQRHRPGDSLGVHRLALGESHLHRCLPVRRRADRAVLAGHQP